MPVSEALPTMRRYHLLLGRGLERAAFEELVAESGTVRSHCGWLGLAESATKVSPIEADARLARWSKRTGRMALRITRTDPSHFWVVVHVAGERSVAIIHDDSPVVAMHVSRLGRIPVLLDTPFGRDPLYEQLVGMGISSTDAAEQVVNKRADELSAALSQDDLDVDAHALRRALSGASEVALVGICELIRATPLLDCIKDLRTRAGGGGFFSEFNPIVGKALFFGVMLPATVATMAFVSVSTRLASTEVGLSPAVSFLAGCAAAAVGILATRWMSRLWIGAERRRLRDLLKWAASSGGGGGVKPSPAAREKWGGLFFLLRDIALLAGIDRPKGPAAVYVDTWGVGPDVLVASLNSSLRIGSDRDAHYTLARQLVELRGRLLEKHLAGVAVDSNAVAEEVRGYIRAAV